MEDKKRESESVVTVVQVVEPCVLSASYQMRRLGSGQEEEEVEVTVSPLIVALSMEVISTLLSPLLVVISDSKPVSCLSVCLSVCLCC